MSDIGLQGPIDFGTYATRMVCVVVLYERFVEPVHLDEWREAKLGSARRFCESDVLLARPGWIRESSMVSETGESIWGPATEDLQTCWIDTDEQGISLKERRVVQEAVCRGTLQQDGNSQMWVQLWTTEDWSHPTTLSVARG